MVVALSFVETRKGDEQSTLKCQREDGFWNVSLHDVLTMVARDLGSDALRVRHGMGIRHGILDVKSDMDPMAQAWNAIVEQVVHEGGSLGYVQGMGKAPSAGQPMPYGSVPDFEDYGLECVLFAGAELCKLQVERSRSWKRSPFYVCFLKLVLSFDLTSFSSSLQSIVYKLFRAAFTTFSLRFSLDLVFVSEKIK